MSQAERILFLNSILKKELVRELLPCLRRLRTKGFSFRQLAAMLNAATADDFPEITPAFLAAHYNQFIMDCIETVGNALIEKYENVPGFSMWSESI